MSIAESLFAMMAALTVSVILTLCVPTWAAVCIALGAVATVAIGGGVLLAQVSGAGFAVALATWLTRNYLRRRVAERMAANVKWVAIPEVQKEAAEEAPAHGERRAA
jgi:hypothetical protein